ncbi:MAG: hypothetical protein K5888_02145 [Lachnospiraceae bacterium]|nr:hypothetical protein [Lachnospiraceae bacterium]
MKKRIAAFTIGLIMALDLFLPAYSEITDDEITVEVESIREEENVETGTQQSARDSVTDVDEDIKDEVEAEILPGWEIIRINSADDLIKLAGDCSLDTWSRNKHVELMKDISLAESGFVQIPTFGGTFEGNGHVISDFIFEEAEPYTGFFAYLQQDAIVRDLTVKGRVEPSDKQTGVGGIAGDNNGVIINCCFDGVIAGSDYVGGIAGVNELSGIIADTRFRGMITGTHFTGGITGENRGNILRCVNEGRVNTSESDVSMSVSDIKIDNYVAMIRSDEDEERPDKADMRNGVVDAGGIAGQSIGIIRFCTNMGDVGYDHIGYNVGGIAGRQSGYVYDCMNEGTVRGRKDVGGIVGQAEPYVTIDLSQDIAYQLNENIEKLHDIISVTLRDANRESDAISNRLSIIQQFTGTALEDTRYLADSTIDYANGISGAANDAFSRVDYILEESSKKDGALDQISYSASNAKKAVDKLSDTVGDLNINDYLSDSEKEEYYGYKQTISDGGNEYKKYISNSEKAFYQYYIYSHASDTDYDAGDLAYINSSNEYTFNRSAINNPCDGRQSVLAPYSDTVTIGSDGLPEDMDSFISTFGADGSWVHHNDTDPSSDSTFPAEETGDRKVKDEKLMADAGDYATVRSVAYADSEYAKNHSDRTYDEDVREATTALIDLLEDNLSDMSEETRNDAREAMNDLGNAADNIDSSFSQTKDLIKNLGDRDAVTFPELSDEYKSHTASLANNLQGMNDNFGLLNSEMNSASDTMINDLQNVSDQFNTIMLLYTDAIDGALDRDYTNTIRDDSLEVAKTCTDATIDNCTNNGKVEGDIDVAGIAGTMAVEYDFDLESDVTGIKDATLNTSYITKCVLRDNENRGQIDAEKSYAGGVCGLQEMGTILHCGCYNDVTSNSGSYTGGIAGASLSNIVNCYSKCILSASEYTGGIVGDGYDISDCISLVKISGSDRWYGAIAGHVSDQGVVRNNFFVSDELNGIDRVSYSKKASPVTYGELLKMYDTGEEGSLPEDFKRMKITFFLDDEGSENDGEVIGTTTLGYGERITINPPDIDSEKEGYYLDYEGALLDRMYTDERVSVKYVRYRTTLAGPVGPDGKQSPILVDGQFKENDVLEAVREIDEESEDRLDGVLETWSIRIPDDGSTTHQLRYYNRETESYEKIVDLDLYVKENGEWKKLDNTGSIGRYRTYEVTGNNIMIQARINDFHRLRKMIIAAIVTGVILLLIAGILIFRFFARKKKNIAKAAKTIRKAAIEAVSNIGSQNELFYHGEEDEHGDPVDENKDVDTAEENKEPDTVDDSKHTE